LLAKYEHYITLLRNTQFAMFKAILRLLQSLEGDSEHSNILFIQCNSHILYLGVQLPHKSERRVGFYHFSSLILA